MPSILSLDRAIQSPYKARVADDFSVLFCVLRRTESYANFIKNISQGAVTLKRITTICYLNFFEIAFIIVYSEICNIL